MRHSKLLFLSIFLILIGCKDREIENGIIEFAVKKEFTLDEASTNKLFSFYPRATSANQSDIIGFSNTKSPVGIILVDYDGNFIEQVGSEGRGPAEILSSRYFGFSQNDKTLAVRDNSSALIKKFNRSNDSVESHEDHFKDGINITSNIMTQCKDSWYLGVSFYQEEDQDSVNTIGVFDSDFRLEKTFGYSDPFFQGNKDVLKKPILHVNCNEGLIYLTHYKVPYIQIYELENYSLKHRIDFKPESFKLSDEFIEMIYDREAYHDLLVNEQSSSLFVYDNEEHIILIFRQATEDYFESRDFNDFIHRAAIYSKKNYSFIGEISIDGIPMGSTKEGYLINMLNEDQDEYRIQLLNVVSK